jgi:hypothetical protein
MRKEACPLCDYNAPILNHSESFSAIFHFQQFDASDAIPVHKRDENGKGPWLQLDLDAPLGVDEQFRRKFRF